jgi:uracil DNA glycosylase
MNMMLTQKTVEVKPKAMFSHTGYMWHILTQTFVKAITRQNQLGD